MTAKSLSSNLFSDQSGCSEKVRNFVSNTCERYTLCRKDDMQYSSYKDSVLLTQFVKFFSNIITSTIPGQVFQTCYL